MFAVPSSRRGSIVSSMIKVASRIPCVTRENMNIREVPESWSSLITDFHPRPTQISLRGFRAGFECLAASHGPSTRSGGIEAGGKQVKRRGQNPRQDRFGSCFLTHFFGGRRCEGDFVHPQVAPLMRFGWTFNLDPLVPRGMYSSKRPGVHQAKLFACGSFSL